MLAIATVGACAPGVEISLQLKPGLDGADEPFDTSALRSLTVNVASSEHFDRHTIPLDRGVQAPLPPLTVERDEPFTVDVWGCDSDTCAIADVTMRGCTPSAVDFTGLEGVFIVNIEIVPVNDPRTEGCPAPR